MSDSAAMEMPMLESNIQSPSFDVPKYHIAYGKDGTLEWTPPVESRELALALSYHFPKQRGLKRKMRAAIRLFFRTLMERPEKAQPNVTSLSGKKSSSKEEQENTFQDPEISNFAPEIRTVSRTDNLVDSTQLIDDVKTREPILDIVPHFPTISEIIWKAETGEEIQLKPKKRQYTERERVEVGNNRGNVCKEHRQKKQKCNPLFCPQNKQFQKNNPGWQGVADQRQFTSQEDSNGNLNDYDHDNSTSLDDRIQSSAPKAYPSYRITGVNQPPMVGMSYINVAGLVGSSRNAPNPGGSEHFVKVIKPNTINNLIDHPSVLSPAISPGGVESPSNAKSPHVSYFDDAWVDSPYRVDDDQSSVSGFEVTGVERGPSPPEISVRRRTPSLSSIYTETYSHPTLIRKGVTASSKRPKEMRKYCSEHKDSEPHGLKNPLKCAGKSPVSLNERRGRRRDRMVKDDYIKNEETDMMVGESEERAVSLLELADHSMRVPTCRSMSSTGDIDELTFLFAASELEPRSHLPHSRESTKTCEGVLDTPTSYRL